eukprot:gene10210-13737_t
MFYYQSSFALGSDLKSLNPYNHFMKTTTHSTIQTGGRITERQIEYLSASNYSSLLSIVVFDNNDTVFNDVNGSWPSTSYEYSFASSLGIKSMYLASTLTSDSAYYISSLIDKLPKPVYVHCHVGWTATLFTELHLYLKGIVKSDDEIYQNGLKYGWDFQINADAVAMINAITNSNKSPLTQEIIEQTLTQGEYSYKYYFWVHRVGENNYWYNVGQILDTQLLAIHNAGYKSIISFRMNGEPTTRLPSEMGQSGYINNHEFSDKNGNYDVKFEADYTSYYNISFYNIPITSTSWTASQFYDVFVPIMIVAEANGPVLTHCTSGYRSAAFTVAYIASKSNKCTEWALQQSSNIGFIYNETTDSTVIQFFQSVLKC